MAAAEELLAAVKNYLDITWEDDAGDTKITGIIARGEAYLDRIAGKALDYTAEGKPRELLLDYCMYVRAGALADFGVNYAAELNALHIDCEVAEYVEEQAVL